MKQRKKISIIFHFPCHYHQSAYESRDVLKFFKSPIVDNGIHDNLMLIFLIRFVCMTNKLPVW